MKSYAFRIEVLSIPSRERNLIISGKFNSFRPKTTIQTFKEFQIKSMLFAIDRGLSVKAIAEYWHITPPTVRYRIREAVRYAREELRAIALRISDEKSFKEMDVAITEYNKQFDQ